MNMRTTKIILCPDAGQSFRFEERSEYILEPFQLRTEALQNLCACICAAGLAAFKHGQCLPCQARRRARA